MHRNLPLLQAMVLAPPTEVSDVKRHPLTLEPCGCRVTVFWDGKDFPYVMSLDHLCALHTATRDASEQARRLDEVNRLEQALVHMRADMRRHEEQARAQRSAAEDAMGHI